MENIGLLVQIILGLLMFLSFVVFTVTTVFSNPDMTEMRLLITYWREYLIMFAVGLVGYLLMTSNRKKRY